MFLDVEVHSWPGMICSQWGFEDMRLRTMYASSVTLYLLINIWG